MHIEVMQYQNENGTYTSPYNGKIYKSAYAIRAHIACRKNGTREFGDLNNQKVLCTYCRKEISYPGVKAHEKNCYLNPKNLRLCAVCEQPIKNYRNSKGTCSHGCSNTFFHSGEDNGNWKEDHYVTTCFCYHKHRCVVCGEELIVVVHHFDGNKRNNKPINLIPLCPTHHQYWHSRYRHLIEDIVICYINEWAIQSKEGR